MLRVSLDLDFTTPGVTSQRTIKLGEPLPVVVMVEHDDADGTPATEFDSLVVQIVFNDGDHEVLSVSPEDYPLAGEIASIASQPACAVSKVALNMGQPLDALGPFQAGTQLALMSPQGAPPEPYRSMTGLAGVRDLDRPIRIESGTARSFAAGRAATGLPSLKKGKTSITALGYALNGSVPVPVKFVPGQVTVTD